MNTCDTTVRVRGVLRYAKVQHHTRTRGTRFGNTAGKPVPVRNPRSITWPFPIVCRIRIESFLYQFRCSDQEKEKSWQIQLTLGHLKQIAQGWALTWAVCNPWITLSVVDQP